MQWEIKKSFLVTDADSSIEAVKKISNFYISRMRLLKFSFKQSDFCLVKNENHVTIVRLCNKIDFAVTENNSVYTVNEI